MDMLKFVRDAVAEKADTARADPAEGKGDSGKRFFLVYHGDALLHLSATIVPKRPLSCQ